MWIGKRRVSIRRSGDTEDVHFHWVKVRVSWMAGETSLVTFAALRIQIPTIHTTITHYLPSPISSFLLFSILVLNIIYIFFNSYLFVNDGI